MTEWRKPTASFTKRIAQKGSKKTQKIDLFVAHLYAEKWGPLCKQFHPKVPLHGQRRKEYWENRYRVRVDNVYVGGDAKYVTFTKEQIYRKWLNF